MSDFDQNLVKTQINYATLLKDEIVSVLKEADKERGRGRKDEAKHLTTLAGAMEWALSQAMPKHLIMLFDDLYLAALNDTVLYETLAGAMGSAETLEMAAHMRGLRD